MTQAEQTFLNRMVPHMIAGASMEDAARAVIADDERIWLATFAKDETGETIRSEFASVVYERIRARK